LSEIFLAPLHVRGLRSGGAVSGVSLKPKTDIVGLYTQPLYHVVSCHLHHYHLFILILFCSQTVSYSLLQLSDNLLFLFCSTAGFVCMAC